VKGARRENARTLAAALGATEQDAAALLDAVVLITVAPGCERFAERLRLLLERTMTTVISRPDELTPASLEVVVGPTGVRSAAAVVSVLLNGTRLMIDDGPVVSPADLQKSTPIVELVAACYAAAAAVQRATRVELPVPLRLPMDIELADVLGRDVLRPNQSADLGKIYMAGAGAIGNAVLLGLSAFAVRGELHICDPDLVSEGNLNRCAWFTASDVDKNKAEQLALRAQGSLPELILVPHHCVLKDVPAARLGGAWLESLIVAVDSRRARRALQNELPRRVFDASTTNISEVVLHFNRCLGEHACMSCVYYEAPDEAAHERHVAEMLGISVTDVQSNFVSEAAAALITGRYPGLDASSLVGLAYDSLFKQLCGQGALKTAADEQVLAPFAFVSVLAGVLLAVEIVRRIDSPAAESPFNYWRVSPWAAPVLRARELRPKRKPCEFCDNRVLQGVARQLWGTYG